MILILEARGRPLAGMARGLEAAGRSVSIAKDVDLRSMKAVRAAVAAVKPSAVVLTGGLDDPLACEDDPARAFELNAEGAIHLAAAALEFRAIPIWISAAAVLGDGGAEYFEDATPAPATAYGRSKLQGETFLLRAAKRGLVIRAGHVFEDGLTAERERLRGSVMASERELVSAVGAFDLGSAIDRLLASDASGVVHAAAADTPMTEAELWREIARACGADPAQVETTSRKGGAALGCGRLAALGIALRPWRAALSEAVGAAGPTLQEASMRLEPGQAFAGIGPARIEVRTGKVVIEEAEDTIVRAVRMVQVGAGRYRIVAVDPAEVVIWEKWHSQDAGSETTMMG